MSRKKINKIGEMEFRQDCPVCHQIYFGRSYRLDENSIHTVYSSCPYCSYNMGINTEICNLLDKNAGFSYDSRTRRGYFNAGELADLIVKALVERWPKPKRGGKD